MAIYSKFLQISWICTALCFLIACSPTQEGSFLSDAASLTDCPQKSCASGVEDPGDTKVVLTSPISNALPTGSSFAEVEGECYASLYPNNRFEVIVTNVNGGALANFFPAGFVPRCVAGRFYFPVSLEGLANGAYTLTANLIVIDKTGAEIRPQFKTITSTLIKR